MKGIAGRITRWSGLGLCFGIIATLLAGCEQPGGDAKLLKIFEPKKAPTTPVLRNIWPARAVWVPRQAYTDPRQIATLMENCRRAGFNAVLFQVRGNGTTLYNSSIEPFSDEYGGRHPGFDPLDVACREAHNRGMALHAWVNVMPGWRGDAPPTDPRQLYNAHPEWFWYDQHGRRQPLGRFYVSLNPCLPEVRQYLVNVCQEIVSRYPVDGLHLDYIRFPTEESPRGSDYPHDRATLALYRKATGKRPQDSRDIWTQWRTQQVSELVRQIRIVTRRARPAARLTASCGAQFENWRRDYCQDGPTWLRYRYVDAIFVMNYTANNTTFRQVQAAWMRAAPGTMIAPGIGVYAHSNDRTTLEQLEMARQWRMGFALFSSNVLFGPDPRAQQRLTAIRPSLLDMQARAPI